MKARPAVALGQPAVPELEQAKPGIGFERPGMRSWRRVFFLPCRPLPPLFFGRSAPISRESERSTSREAAAFPS